MLDTALEGNPTIEFIIAKLSLIYLLIELLIDQVLLRIIDELSFLYKLNVINRLLILNLIERIVVDVNIGDGWMTQCENRLSLLMFWLL